MNIVAKFAKDESGATAIEYGLIAALIAVAIIVGATTIGGQLKLTFDHIGTSLTTANTSNGITGGTDDDN
jgi:pilus assembly protein Flp/PilA